MTTTKRRWAAIASLLVAVTLLVGANTGVNPARRIVLITPGASVLTPDPRSLYIATDGTIDVTNSDDTTAAGIPVFAGSVLPIRPKKITAATATVYGLYDD